MKRRNRKHAEGYSLIEVVVAIAILGFVTAPVCASLVLSLRLNESSRALMNAQLEASAAVEMLMAEGISTDSALWPTEVNGATVDIEEPEGETGYYIVTVTGKDGGKEVVLRTSIRAVEGGDT